MIEAPLYVDFLLTPVCNYKCSFCSASKINNIDAIKTLSLDVIRDTLIELDRMEVLRVSFEGGEPFLRDDIFDILAIADECDFEYYINTNGSLLSDDIIDKLSKTRISTLCLSIDGDNPEIHDLSRGVQGAFNKINSVVPKLLEKNIKVNAIITLTKYNYRNIYDLILYIESLGIANASIMLLANVGDADGDIGLTYEEWESTLIDLSLKKKSKEIKLNLKIVPTSESLKPWEIYLPLKKSNNLDLFNVWISEDNKSLSKENQTSCTAGKSSMAIDGYGNVYGCSLMVSMPGLSAGNINYNSINEIWNESEIFNIYRNMKYKDIEGKCSTCDELKQCKGGCRACSYSATNKYNGSDERCFYN